MVEEVVDEAPQYVLALRLEQVLALPRGVQPGETRLEVGAASRRQAWGLGLGETDQDLRRYERVGCGRVRTKYLP